MRHIRATAPFYFALVIFGIGSHVFAWGQVSDCDPFISASCVVGITVMYCYAQLLVELGGGVSLTFCLGLASNCDPPDPPDLC
jgi:hypothetical protein